MSRALQHLWCSRKYRVNYQPVYPNDAASLVCLNRFYQKRDDTRYTDFKMLNIRNKWMNEQEALYGVNNLTCAICGRTGLSPDTSDKRNLATLDHIIPISKANYLWNNPTNFQVACYICNQKKENH